VAVNIVRSTGEDNWIGRERLGRDIIISSIDVGKLEDRNANEEVPGRLAQQILSRRNNGKIILEVSRAKEANHLLGH
jgi:hypothetical protein